MNLDDLRAHLQTQATEIEPAAPAPITDIRRRRTILKRRRAGALAAGLAAVVAVAVAILPGTLNSSTPAPATPPPGVTREGITLPGTVGAAWLNAAGIGKVGENPLQLSWTPSSDSALFRPYCRTLATTAKYINIVVNGRILFSKECNNPGTSPTDGHYIAPDHILWSEAPLGKAAAVQVIVVDEQTGRQGDSLAQVALGIYRAPTSAAAPGGPSEPAAVGPGDYVKDHIRFPAKTSGDTLLAASVGDVGQRSLTMSFTAAGAGTGLRTFCTANRGEAGNRLVVSIDGREAGRTICSNFYLDISQEVFKPFPVQAGPGQVVKVTLDVVDRQGRPVTEPNSRIAVGAYDLAPSRVVQDSSGQVVSVAPVIVGGAGRHYKFAGLRSAKATDRHLSIAIPAGKPFALEACSSDLGGLVSGKASGFPGEFSFEASPDAPGPVLGIGNGRYTAPAGKAATVTLRITRGEPTKGVLVLALYLPE
jgi:hypothetical protein